jgi:hypothetical protein
MPVFRSTAALAELKAGPEVPVVRDDSIEALAVLTAEPPALVSRRWTRWAGYRRSAALVARVSGPSKRSARVAQPPLPTAVSFRSTAALAALRSGHTEAHQPGAAHLRTNTPAERAARTGLPMAAALRREHPAPADFVPERAPSTTYRGQGTSSRTPAAASQREHAAHHAAGTSGSVGYRGLSALAALISGRPAEQPRSAVADDQSTGADLRTPLTRHTVADGHTPSRRHTTGVDRTQRYRGHAARTKVG